MGASRWTSRLVPRPLHRDLNSDFCETKPICPETCSTAPPVGDNPQCNVVVIPTTQPPRSVAVSAAHQGCMCSIIARSSAFWGQVENQSGMLRYRKSSARAGQDPSWKYREQNGLPEPRRSVGQSEKESALVPKKAPDRPEIGSSLIRIESSLMARASLLSRKNSLFGSVGNYLVTLGSHSAIVSVCSGLESRTAQIP